MKSWKFTLAALLIFAAGGVTGFTLSNLQAKTRRQAEVTRRETFPLMLWQRFEQLRRVERQLELTAEQRSKIEGQIKERQEHFRKLWEPLAPQAKVELEQLRANLIAELTPEQKTKFEELMRQRSGRRPGEGTNAPANVVPPATNTPSAQSPGN
ncbi:MAG TPA: hypothetical protein VMB21_10795 [Candidatus Limnocylindria bacterium]|nr:hypothetical protein [Candidatus Limnocylindria bacterium]